MNIQDVYTAFINGLVDKYGDAQIEDVEFNNLFNQSALQELIADYKPMGERETPIQNKGWESTQQLLDKWFTLIKPITFTIPTDGKVLWPTIETAAGAKVFHIDNVFRGDYYARWVRHNDRGVVLRNRYKKPTDAHPIWSGYSDYVLVEPVASTGTATVTTYPIEAVIDTENPTNNVDPNLTDIALRKIIDRMAQRYGITIREQQLFQDTTQINND